MSLFNRIDDMESYLSRENLIREARSRYVNCTLEDKEQFLNLIKTIRDDIELVKSELSKHTLENKLVFIEKEYKNKYFRKELVDCKEENVLYSTISRELTEEEILNIEETIGDITNQAMEILEINEKFHNDRADKLNPLGHRYVSRYV